MRNPIMKALMALGMALCLGITPLWAQKSPAEDIRQSLQTQFIFAEAGDTIHIPAGTFRSSGTISMDEKKNVVIKGAGIDKTTLSFKGQSTGAEGIRITHSENITLMGMTLQDAKGDCIKVMDTKGIAMVDLKVEWTGKPNKKNGAYGFYPVSCENVLIDQCIAIGASDAGIYVGQSHNIVVRNSEAFHNVAGIEIENSTQADVHDCHAHHNTGGILVFDLPDLPKAKGGQVRIFNNLVEQNNYKNFAPKGNIVGKVPPGTGVIVLATNEVEIFGNKILEHKTVGLPIISYYMTEQPINDKKYYPYPTAIYVHDNVFERKPHLPSLKNRMGLLMFMKFKRKVPDIIYDGIVDEKTLDEGQQVKEPLRICIRNNGDATFAFLDAEHKFKGLHRNPEAYDCERVALEAVKISMR